jgi:ABC-2 type transport system permease protein
MAVYERSYRPYAGQLTPRWSRWLVFPAYSLREAFRSRFFTGFFVLCFIPFLGSAAVIYIRHNLQFLVSLGIIQGLQAADLPSIDGRAFLWFLTTMSPLAFLTTVVVGPALVAPDLANNGLPLILSRPISRTEYVLGKMSVLGILLSALTWVPALLLFGFQASFAGASWLIQHLDVAAAIVVASLLYIVLLSLLALAISAWVRSKLGARGLLFGIFLILGGLSEAINGILNTYWGLLLDPADTMTRVWRALFGLAPVSELPLWSAWAALAAIGLISIGLLNRRLRAFEVVRS